MTRAMDLAPKGFRDCLFQRIRRAFPGSQFLACDFAIGNGVLRASEKRGAIQTIGDNLQLQFAEFGQGKFAIFHF